MRNLVIQKKDGSEGGYVLLLVLAFMAIFLVIIGGLSGYVIMENRQANIRIAREKAFYIAEAGLNYYRWHLAHYPDDFNDGEGATSTGPYVHAYSDPEGGTFGNFSLQISGNRSCDETTSVDLTSTGRSDDFPNYERIIHAKYARPSVAQYTFIFNEGVWFGDSEVVKGPVHSNGGIRMDGTSHSSMTTAVPSWLCTSSYGCSPQKTVDGIFGTGIDSSLWKFPVPQVDFTGLSVDLSNMKQKAQESGVYFGPSGDYGYHVIFKGDGTFDIYKVTKAKKVRNYDGTEWQWSRNIITSEDFMGNYSVPSSCSLIFVEDKLWVDGTVKGKVTIASANVQDPNGETDVILSGNMLYAGTDGSDGITVIAEGNILIPRNAPNDMELDGIFIAQNGKFGMNYFPGYEGYGPQETLTIFGTVVSNERPVTSWLCGGGVVCSGFADENDSYNQSLVTDPPPLTPTVNDQYGFVEWDEAPIE